jgi:hypothetical protein
VASRRSGSTETHATEPARRWCSLSHDATNSVLPPPAGPDTRMIGTSCSSISSRRGRRTRPMVDGGLPETQGVGPAVRASVPPLERDTRATRVRTSHLHRHLPAGNRTASMGLDRAYYPAQRWVLQTNRWRRSRRPEVATPPRQGRMRLRRSASELLGCSEPACLRRGSPRAMPRADRRHALARTRYSPPQVIDPSRRSVPRRGDSCGRWWTAHCQSLGRGGAVSTGRSHAPSVPPILASQVHCPIRRTMAQRQPRLGGRMATSVRC